MIKIKKILFCFALLVIPLHVNATETSGKTVREISEEINKNEDIESFDINLSNYDTNVPVVSSFDQGKNVSVGESYYVEYKNAIDYFGKKLNIRYDIKYEKEGASNGVNRSYVYIDSNSNRINLVTTHREPLTDTANWEIKESFIDEKGNLYSVNIITGIDDPDGGNYSFKYNDGLYYVDADKTGDISISKLADAYYVQGNKFIAKYLSYQNANDFGYENGLFLSYLNGKNEQTYNFELWNDGVSFPNLYYFKKEYKITYILDGGINNAVNPNKYKSGKKIIIEAPTKNGYEFKGWVEGNVIEAWEKGDKVFTAVWEKKSVDNLIENPKTGTFISIIILLLALVLGPVLYYFINNLKKTQ